MNWCLSGAVVTSCSSTQEPAGLSHFKDKYFLSLNSLKKISKIPFNLSVYILPSETCHASLSRSCLSLQPREDIIGSPNQGISGPIKRTDVFQKYRIDQFSVANHKTIQLYLIFIDILNTFSGSFIVSAFSTNFYILFLTFGVMFGAAQPFVFVGGATVLFSYFKNKKGLATSKYHTHNSVGRTFVLLHALSQWHHRSRTQALPMLVHKYVN